MQSGQVTATVHGRFTMPNDDTITLAPSDVLTSASDELGDALASVRSKALEASGDDRDSLFAQYKKLVNRQQKLMLRDLKVIDQDPDIVDAVQKLAMLSQQIAKVTREMKTAQQAIDGATKVLGLVDQILGILGKVGLLA